MSKVLLITGASRGFGAAIARLITTNVIGAMLCSRGSGKTHVDQAGCGAGDAIVNLSSLAAQWGSGNEYVNYAASKGAIDTFTMGLAREVATENIRVNAVRLRLTHSALRSASAEHSGRQK